MQTIVYKGENYVSGKQVVDQLRHFFNGYENPKKFVTQSGVTKDKYVILRYDKENKDYKEGEKYASRIDFIWFKTDYYNEIREINKKMVEDEEELLLKTPGKLLLEDEEKFKNDKGIILEIETIGERQVDKIFFNADDIADQFKSPNLKKDIVREESSFAENTDYVFFAFRDGGKCSSTKLVKKMYLTYEGVLRFLFVSRNKKTSHFVKWAVNVLFTVQLGYKEEKHDLAAEVLGVASGVLRQVLSTNVGDVACIYLFFLGTVKELRKSMNIPKKFKDNDLVFKYGRTINLSRRTKEHNNTYGTIDGCVLMIKAYCYIDPLYTSEAETELKNYMHENELKLNYENHDELVVVEKKKEKAVVKKIKEIGNKYTGKVTELVRQIKELSEEIEKQKIEYEEKLQKQKEHYEEIIENKEVESRKKLKRQKNKYEELMDRQQEKHESEMDLKDANHKSEMEIKDVNHRSEIEIKDVNHKMEISKIETRHEKEKSAYIEQNNCLKKENEKLQEENRKLQEELNCKKEPYCDDKEHKYLKKENERLEEEVNELKQEKRELKQDCKELKQENKKLKKMVA